MTTAALLPRSTGPIETAEIAPGAGAEESGRPFDAVLANVSGEAAIKPQGPVVPESIPGEETPTDVLVAEEDKDDSDAAPREEEAEEIVLLSCLAAWQNLPPLPPLAPQLGNRLADCETNEVFSRSVEPTVMEAPTTNRSAEVPVEPTPDASPLRATGAFFTPQPQATAATTIEVPALEASQVTSQTPTPKAEKSPLPPTGTDRSEKTIATANKAGSKALSGASSAAESLRPTIDGIPVAKEHRAMTEPVFQHPAKIAPAAFAEGETPTPTARDASPEMVIGTTSAEATGSNDARDGMTDRHQDRPTGSFSLPADRGHSLDPETPTVEPSAANDTAQVIQNIERAMERMRSQGNQRMELRLPMRDGEEVIVNLRIEQGEVKASFQSDSEGLRQALEAGWSQVAQVASDRSGKAATTITESSSLPNGSGNFQQSPNQHDRRGNGREFEASFTPLPASFEAKKPTTSPRPTAGNQPSANLALYA